MGGDFLDGNRNNAYFVQKFEKSFETTAVE